MKLLRYLLITTITIISTFVLVILYDLSSYDSSYINRSPITFSENNLNSKKIKKIFKEVEANYEEDEIAGITNTKEMLDMDKYDNETAKKIAAKLDKLIDVNYR